MQVDSRTSAKFEDVKLTEVQYFLSNFEEYGGGCIAWPTQGQVFKHGKIKIPIDLTQNKRTWLGMMER